MNAPVKIPVRSTDIIAHFSLNGQYKWGGTSAIRASWKFGRYNGNQLFFQASKGLSERLVP